MNKPAETKRIERQPISERDFGLEEQHYRSFSAYVPADYEEADLESPAIWVHVARKMSAGSELRCMAEDMSWVAYCLVMSVNGPNVLVKVLAIHVLDKVLAQEAKSGLEVKFRGPVRKFGVIDCATGTFLKDGIPSKLQAMQEMEDFIKARAVK